MDIKFRKNNVRDAIGNTELLETGEKFIIIMVSIVMVIISIVILSDGAGVLCGSYALPWTLA